MTYQGMGAQGHGLLKAAQLIALYDACVLYPAPLRDLLMHLALTGLYSARWTEQIHEEWIRNLLRLDSAGGAIHAPHAVEKTDRHAPQRHVLEPPRPRLPIVAGRWPATARTERPPIGTRLDRNLDSGTRSVSIISALPYTKDL